MAREIVMPQLGISMDSGRVSRWLKGSGDRVAAGDVLLEVESDKAIVEVEAVAGGRLYIIAGEAGSDVKVGTVIGYILAEGESAPGVAMAAAQSPVAGRENGGTLSAARPGSTVPVVPVPANATRRLPSSPAARRLARELAVDWRQAQGTGLNGRVRERDVVRLAQALQAAIASAVADTETAQHAVVVQAQHSTEEDDSAPRMSPLARDLAASLGIEPAALAARFPGQRVQREDVLLAVREWLQSKTAPAPRPTPAAPEVRRPARRQAMGAVRRLIAERMSHSSQATAAVTLTTEVDATELVRLRETLKAQPDTGPVPSYNVLLAKIVACALALHPDLNASLEDGEVVHWATANIGIAVDTERGLVVPVLVDVAAKPLGQLAAQAEDLLGRAGQSKALPAELTGGTFTISNLGVYQIDAFTPIINSPECAILGVGRLRLVPAIDASGAVTARTMLYLSLTFDHRLVDGAPAARFLQRVSQYVEQPYLWLAR